MVSCPSFISLDHSGTIWVLGGASCADICWQLHNVSPSESDLFFQDQLLPLKNYSKDTCIFFFPFSFVLLYLQDILPFVFHNSLAMGRICMASDEHAASLAFCRPPIPRQIANGVCTIEQVKLAASVWFAEDERDAGFCFTYQPGLVSSQKGSGEMQGRTCGRNIIWILGRKFNQNLCFLLYFLLSLVENDQGHTSQHWIGNGCNYLKAVNLELTLLIRLRFGEWCGGHICCREHSCHGKLGSCVPSAAWEALQ